MKDEEQPTGTGKEVDWVINDEVQAGGGKANKARRALPDGKTIGSKDWSP